GTGDVRPDNTFPWNFNSSGLGYVEDTALNLLKFDAITKTPIPADLNDSRYRYFSFLIGGGGSADALPFVSFEIDPSYPACTGNYATGAGYVPMPGVDIYYGYRGTWPTIAARLAAGKADLGNTTAKVNTPNSETLTLVIIDLWGRTLDGKPNA